MEREELIDSLEKSYSAILPLLYYLKARLKYDTARWIRVYGTKDDIVFSTRIKTFDRVYSKLVRAAHPFTKSSTILDIALSKRQPLNDLVGIRFICFDPFNLYSLIQYFMTTERVATSHRSFYVSPRTNSQDPLFLYLKANGFKMDQKPDRDYEDINFILRFSHPIDRYFESGRKLFHSLGERAKPQSPDEKFNAVTALFNELVKDRPELIEYISQFPIECQIVTATQHIYNKTQRPHYEYVVQAKNGAPSIAAAEVRDLADRLEVLKLALLATDKSVYSINQKFGIRYEPPIQIDLGVSFPAKERLPSDFMGLNSRFEAIDGFLPELIDPRKISLKRLEVVGRILAEIKAINRSIAERAKDKKDVWESDVLTVKDLPGLSLPEILFWAYQRIVLLTICVILLYAPDDDVRRKIASSMNFANDFDGTANLKLDDIDIILGRLFRKLEAMDNAVDLKLRPIPPKIKGWREGVFSVGLFSDPLIQWRYASYRYSRREYKSALKQIKVGLGAYTRLQELKQAGIDVSFPVPERAAFLRRGVEYELYDELTTLTFSTSFVAGALELCNVVAARYEGWRSQLEEAIKQSSDPTEQARCLCFLILLRLCALSAGGLKGETVEAAKREFERQFVEMESSLANARPNGVRERTWWLLAKSVISDQESKTSLEQFRIRSERTHRHTVERKRFQGICADLIALWIPEGHVVSGRAEFAANTLGLLEAQIKPFAESPALSTSITENSRALSELSGQLRIELKKTGHVATREKLGKRLGEFISEAAQHILIDTIVASLRAVLGI
jgi:hypothetical protein